MKRGIVLAAFLFCICILTAAPVYAAAFDKPAVTVSSTGDATVRISWKKVSGATKLTVYRSVKKGSGYNAVKTIKGNKAGSYTDKKLTFGKKYYYKIRAVSGKKSKTSSVQAVTVGQAGGLKATGGAGTIQLQWTKVSGAKGYEVYISDRKDGKYKKVKTLSKTTYKHTGLSCSKTYYFKVRAYKTKSGKQVRSAFSPVKSGKTKGHAFSAWSVQKKAGCTTAGSKVRTCKICRKKETASIAKTGHTYKKKTVAPTCTQKGYSVSTCSACGYTVKAQYTPAKGHQLVLRETVMPTCIADGARLYTCAVCGAEIAEVLGRDTAPHCYAWFTQAPSCMQAGYRVLQCTLCGRVQQNTFTIIGALGHDLPDAPVFTEDGTSLWICRRCNKIVFA